MRKNKGITLIALVITIIILLILAGISIATLTGSGLFENARLAEQKSKNAQEKEDSILGDYEKKIGEYVDSSRETVTIPKEEYNKLKNLLNYSTEEQIIGTWIDGKNIYQKTFTNLEMVLTWWNAGDKFTQGEIDPLIDNVDKIIMASGNDTNGGIFEGSCFLQNR